MNFPLDPLNYTSTPWTDPATGVAWIYVTTKFGHTKNRWERFQAPFSPIQDSDIASSATWNGKQAALVSGTNLKTVGGISLLGSGDVGAIGVGYGGTGATTAGGARVNLGAGAVGDSVFQAATVEAARDVLKVPFLADGAITHELNDGGQFAIPISLVGSPSKTFQIGDTITQVPGKWIETYAFTETSFLTNDIRPSRITSLSVSDLAGISSTCNISYLQTLVSLRFPSLIFCGGDFNPYNFSELLELSLPELVFVGGTFNANNLPKLTQLSAPKLKYIRGNFNAYNMALLTSISLPALMYVCGGLSPNGMASLTSLVVPELRRVASISLNNLPALTEVGFPKLEISAYTVVGWGTGNLETFSAPLMIEYFGPISITGNYSPKVTSVILGTPGTLKYISGATIVLSGLKLTETCVNAILALLVSLDGTNGTCLWGSGKTLTINGGTSASPSGQGLTDKATLQARGATINTN